MYPLSLVERNFIANLFHDVQPFLAIAHSRKGRLSVVGFTNIILLRVPCRSSMLAGKGLLMNSSRASRLLQNLQVNPLIAWSRTNWKDLVNRRVYLLRILPSAASAVTAESH